MSGTAKDSSVLGQVSNGFNSYVKAITSYDASNGSWGTRDSVVGGLTHGIADIGGGASGNGKFVGANMVANLIGYNPANGKWGDKGSDVDWLNEGVGQINGSNAARHAAGVAGDAVNLAAQQEATLESQKEAANQQSDINASNSAAAIRATSKATGAFNPSMTTALALGPAAQIAANAPKLGTDQQDFLGL